MSIHKNQDDIQFRDSVFIIKIHLGKFLKLIRTLRNLRTKLFRRSKSYVRSTQNRKKPKNDVKNNLELTVFEYKNKVSRSELNSFPIFSRQPFTSKSSIRHQSSQWASKRKNFIRALMANSILPFKSGQSHYRTNRWNWRRLLVSKLYPLLSRFFSCQDTINWRSSFCS